MFSLLNKWLLDKSNFKDKVSLIEGIATGESHISLAYAESNNSLYDYDNLKTNLKASTLNGVKTLVLNGNEEQKKKYLPQIVSGKITTSIAIDESTHHNPSDTNLQANYINDKKFLLNGKKLMVMDGASSDVTIILARTSGNKGDITGLSLFIVETNNPNIKINKLISKL